MTGASGADRAGAVIEPFTVSVCRDGGHALHPPRPICPTCGTPGFETAIAATGVLQEVTVRRAIAQPRRLPAGDPIDQREALLGRVRVDLGPVVICRVIVEDGAPAPAPGACVRLRVRVLEAGSRVAEAVVVPEAIDRPETKSPP